MKPVYEFRPLPDYFNGSFKRYANGMWVPDDGEYDLAFIGNAKEGFPLCLYVETQHRENIVCSWHGRCSYTSYWHYNLKIDTSDWGDSNYDYNHPNRIASDSGMRTKSSESGCCNGRSISFQFDDKHIAAGLLRTRDTKQVFEWSNISCSYCGNRPVQTETNKVLKYAVARHTALKRIGAIHPSFDKCDCTQVVIEQSLYGA